MQMLPPRLAAWLSAFRTQGQPGFQSRSPTSPVLIVVEGPNDILLLKRMSTLLSKNDSRLPDLIEWEARGQCLFLPVGGGDAIGWTQHLAILGLPEFHLYDGEVSPATEVRRSQLELFHRRARCRAFLTAKRSLDNYLHPAAVRAALGIELAIEDNTAVADSVAQALLARAPSERDWDALPYRSRKRRRERAKRLLVSRVAAHMTSELLADRDPAREVDSWLRAIAELVVAR